MAKAMEYNISPISLKEGKIFVNGVECGDGFTINIKFTPDVWTGNVLGKRSKNSRWLGGGYSGTMTRGRTNAFIKDAITHYMETGETPEITIQGIQNDKGSDYYAETGKVEVVTAVGCVLTGDLTLLNLDADGDIFKDTITFNAADVVYG